jgi:hypothetical protein
LSPSTLVELRGQEKHAKSAGQDVAQPPLPALVAKAPKERKAEVPAAATIAKETEA